MKIFRIGKTMCVCAIALTCALGLTACSDLKSEDTDTKIEGLTGGIAATVNGAEIQEDDVTTEIETYRISANLTEKDAWGQWLVDYDYTPQSVRENMIDSRVDKELIKKAAEENGVEVQDSEVDEYVNKTKSAYDTDTAWKEALEIARTTEDKYHESVKQALLEQKVRDTVAQATEPTEKEILESAQTTYASYYNGAKRSSHILFNAGDDATAQEVLDRINAGELDFADAAKEYSQDTGSATNGGDVGWDKMNTFVTEYTETLNSLEKNQISGLVASEYGIHIIECTDVFVAPEKVTELGQIPSEFVDAIKGNLGSSKKSEAYDKWLEDYRNKAEVVINDMPENVPYNVDVTQYTKTDTSATTGEITAESTESEQPTETE